MPQHLLVSLGIGTATTATFLFGQIDNTTHIPLGNAVAGVIFVSGLVWYVARKIQSVEDGQESSKKAVAELTANQTTLIQNQRVIMDDLRDLRHDLSSRPCQKADCEHIK